MQVHKINGDGTNDLLEYFKIMMARFFLNPKSVYNIFQIIVSCRI